MKIVGVQIKDEDEQILAVLKSIRHTENSSQVFREALHCLFEMLTGGNRKKKEA